MNKYGFNKTNFCKLHSISNLTSRSVESVLKVQDLTKLFGRIRAINNLNFDIKKGQVLGILGPNGSGKTTTLATVLGIRPATSGTFSWFNYPEGKLENQRIGSLIEIPYFYPYLNLERNLSIVAKIRGKGGDEIVDAIEMVGLSQRSKSKYSTLSLGMKQRLALASALLGNPEVLVLDEPTNGLDPEGIAEVRSIIKEQSARGKTIILASHILDEVEKVCSDVIILKDGEIISQGPVRELLTEKLTVSLSAESIENLTVELNSIADVEIVDTTPAKIIVNLEEGFTTTKLNELLMQRGITLSMIEIHKKTLESKFLELVKQ